MALRQHGPRHVGARHEPCGGCGLPVNLSEARRYYQMAADAGDEEAPEALARLNAADDD